MGYESWEIIPQGYADALAPMHSLLPNIFARSWWRPKKN